MKINNKSISIAFVIILAATVIISLAGMLLMNRQPLVLQGQVEATEIRISGKLPGRVDSFLVQRALKKMPIFGKTNENAVSFYTCELFSDIQIPSSF